MTAATKTDLKQVTAARRMVINPALSENSLTSLSCLNRRVRTRMLGGVGAGEGDLPGYPIRRLPIVSPYSFMKAFLPTASETLLARSDDPS